MPDPSYDTTALPALQNSSAFPDLFAEVLTRLPVGWQEQAKVLEAWQRRREIETPADLLRGLLAYQLQTYSFRQLGAWSLLSGLADISEAAWRKHLSKSGRWLSWILTQTLASTSAVSPWLLAKGLRRVVLFDGTHLRCLGKAGETWRIHTGYDLLAGRLTEVEVTDTHVGEDWRRLSLQEGDLVVSDSINGYPEHIAHQCNRGVEVVVRFSPNTLPLCDEQEHRIEVTKWLKGRHAPAGRICSRDAWLTAKDGNRHKLRLIALRLTAKQTAASVRRKKKKASQDKRKSQRKLLVETIYLAGWLLIVTSLPQELWSDAEVLALYRARWHIELLFKRLKQLLSTHELRCENPESIKASILLFLLCWALQEEEAVQMRHRLQEMQQELAVSPSGYVMPEPGAGQEQAISEWMLASLSLDLLRTQVHGMITHARLRECLPRLQRFVRGSPRRRTHWFSQVCSWLRSPAA